MKKEGDQNQKPSWKTIMTYNLRQLAEENMKGWRVLEERSMENNEWKMEKRKKKSEEKR